MLAPGTSSLYACRISRARSNTTLNGSEHIVDGGFAIPWGGIGGSQLKAWVSGVFQVVGASTVTFRLRVGGTALPRTAVGGTVVHTFTVSAGLGQVREEVSPLATNPNTNSYLQLTVQGTAGTTCIIDHLAVGIIPDYVAQMVLLSGALTAGTVAGAEMVTHQWLVDFDQFSSADLRAAIAVCDESQTGNHLKVRIGGTAGAADGTLILNPLLPVTAGNFIGAAATIARPTGKQLVKICNVNTYTHAAGILLRGL